MLASLLGMVAGPHAAGGLPPAYIDPGTGSLLIQAALATALAVPFILRNKIVGAWRRLRGRGPTPAAPDSSGEPRD